MYICCIEWYLGGPARLSPDYCEPIRRLSGPRPRHIVGSISREELDDLGAILDRSEPPKGDQLGPVTVALGADRNNRRMFRPVAITPGAIQFAVMPNGPRSCAKYRV